MMVPNKDHKPNDYSETDFYPRPSHADWTYLKKYGVKASSGGGRASARETIGRVAAGSIAEKYLKQVHNVEIVSFVSSVGKAKLECLGSITDDTKSKEFFDLIQNVTRQDVDVTPTRCPDKKTAELITQEIMRRKEENNSIGGTITCVIRNCPIGLGEPCFDKLEAKLAHAMLSIPATKGFEIGSGFLGTQLSGREHNDAFVSDGKGGLRTVKNHSGGIQGGISNGENIYFTVAFKPAATISVTQETATYDGKTGTLETRGRHDPCVASRAVPIVESMAALVIME
ncbi:Chorismate synthase, partial [Smittium culicis]